jgi:hypothetical protein
MQKESPNKLLCALHLEDLRIIYRCLLTENCSETERSHCRCGGPGVTLAFIREALVRRGANVVALHPNDLRVSHVVGVLGELPKNLKYDEHDAKEEDVQLEKERDVFLLQGEKEEEILDQEAARVMVDMVSSGHPATFEPLPPVWAPSSGKRRVLLRKLLSQVDSSKQDRSTAFQKARRVRDAFRVPGFSNTMEDGLAISHQELYHTQGYYGRDFSPQLDWVLRTNDTATHTFFRAMESSLDTKATFVPSLHNLLLRTCEDVQDRLAERGVADRARLRIKGSRSVFAVVHAAAQRAKGVDPVTVKRIEDQIERLFGYGDMDVNILVDPSLSEAEFERVHRVCVEEVAASLVRFKAEMDHLLNAKEDGEGKGTVRERVLGALQAMKAPGEIERLENRKSFVIHRLFKEQKPGKCSGLAGWHNLVMFTEVPRWRTGPNRREVLPETPVYLSYNELKFLNGTYEASFTLLRAMLSLVGKVRGGKNARKLHVELLDFSVPKRDDETLSRAYNAKYTGISGTKLRTLAIFEQLHDMLNAMRNASQRHKTEKRIRRVKAFQVLFCAMEDARLLEPESLAQFQSLEEACLVLLKRELPGGSMSKKNLLLLLLDDEHLAPPNKDKQQNLERRLRNALPKETLRELVQLMTKGSRARPPTYEARRRAVLALCQVYSTARQNGWLFWTLKPSQVASLVQGKDPGSTAFPVVLPEDHSRLA